MDSTRPLLEERTATNQDGVRVKQIHSRLLALDLFRGLIICIMAWDHTTHPFTGNDDAVHGPGFEVWEGPYQVYDNAPRKFLSRVVSHICAPGFFVTMGMSLIFFTGSRTEKLGWSWSRIFRHHLVRGSVLLLIEYMKDFAGTFPKLVDILRGRDITDWRGNQYHKGEEGKMIYQTTLGVNEVMTALGLTMILSQLAMPLFFAANRWRVGAAEVLGFIMFLTSFAISNIAIVLGQGDADLSNPPSEFPHFSKMVSAPQHLLGRILFWPGQLFSKWEALLYPVFPWIGIVFLGMGLAFTLKRNSRQAYRGFAGLSLTFFTAFCFVRGFGGVLNYRGRQRDEDLNVSALMEFFLQTKYPPDWAYGLITLSVDFALIFLFSFEAFEAVEKVDAPWVDPLEDVENAVTRINGRESSSFVEQLKNFFAWGNIIYPLLVFGRTPMFFYITHQWLINFLEALFRIPEPPGGKFRFFPGVMIVWLIVLTIMYQFCKRYLAFKSSTSPDSLWRLF